MAKDYYLVLGVAPDATMDQIKSAYRKMAKRWHPDHSQGESGPFQNIQEAYDVLGDAGRRKAYDEERAREKRVQRTAKPVRPEPVRRRSCPVEPLVPTQRTGDPRSAFSESPFLSLIEDLFRYSWPGPEALIQPRDGTAGQELQIQVSLNREQALHGGRIRVWVPVRNRCPACRGRGWAGFFECLHCHGSGAVVDERPVEVAFPGGLVSGIEGRVSLSRPGMGDLTLVLHFRVGEW